MMSEYTAIPFNPVIRFHGDVKRFAMLATVARFPYLQRERNGKVDVETIPRPGGAKVE